MEQLREEVLKECVEFAKVNNRSDFENIFKTVMNKRLSFYRVFEENKEMNMINIESSLRMGA